jgi:hypothetical protein
VALTLAQAVEDLGGSSTLLGALLSGALLITVTGVYRFVVNFRNTERGMNRKRIQDATRNERAALREAALWQARSGDLEYLLKQNGISVPGLNAELRALVDADAAPEVRPPEDDPAIDTGSL